MFFAKKTTSFQTNRGNQALLNPSLISIRPKAQSPERSQLDCYTSTFMLRAELERLQAKIFRAEVS